MKAHRREVFLYLENSDVEKTSDLAGRHFSGMPWLFKHRLKTKEGVVKDILLASQVPINVNVTMSYIREYVNVVLTIRFLTSNTRYYESFL